MTTRLKENYCPACHHLLDAATAIDGEDVSPKKNDLTICINCYEILEFDEDITPVHLEGETLASLPSEVLTQVIHARMMLMIEKQVY